MTTWKPVPGGTVVRAVHPDLDVALVSACRDHVFETMQTAQAVEASYAECRYVQSARCLVCGYITPAVDADFFVEATSDDLTACLAWSDRTVESLRKARDEVSRHRFPEPAFLLPAEL